jgi:diaminopimelate epimerase
MRRAFTKMQGLGNDFVVFDATERPLPVTPALLRQIADRRLGIGCDQVLVVAPPSRPGLDFDYIVYNSDGSESGQCGNGARCVARFLRERGLSDRDRIRIGTRTSDMTLQCLPDGRVRVDMGTPRWDPAALPFDAAARAPRYTLAANDSVFEIGAVSLGNPHAVLEVSDVDTAPVAEVGALLQRHPAFPDSVNVGFLQVLDAGHVRLRVFERGTGETLACGSGACAAAAVGRLWGRLDAQVAVQLRGGELDVEWEGEGRPLFMTGPANTVYWGEIEWPEP